MSILSRIFNRTDFTKLPLDGWPNYLENIPAIPIAPSEVPSKLESSLARKAGLTQIKWGFSQEYTINNRTGSGYQFMFEGDPDPSQMKANALLLRLIGTKRLTQEFLGSEVKDTASIDLDSLTYSSLHEPEQWTMSWTTSSQVDERGEAMRSAWVSTLTDAEQATKLFWPTIAEHGLVYNLLILQKVGADQFDTMKDLFKSVWSPEWDAWYKAGNLYAIDLSLFKSLKVNKALEVDRFTPSTITLLKQDAQSKAITPVAVHLSGHEGKNAVIYTRKDATDSAWLYALQAAKVSVTVYGIWLGHVYQWHIVTGAMQMTMLETFSEQHPIYQLLAPQSNHLIPFDTLLLAFWKELAPPTSIYSGNEFLQLCNTFAKGREFFDDDPRTKLDKFGLKKEDFTKDEDWDLYPIVSHYLNVWNATERYVKTFVEQTYHDDEAVINDKALQKWIVAAKGRGNIKGLPNMDSQDALKQVLTSVIYRITMHGASRLNSGSLPALTFVANFPPCLQRTDIPRPDQEFDTETLLSYLPKTGLIGRMLNFYFVFVFSAPYDPFIPIEGVDHGLFFEDANDERNKALITYRQEIIQMINSLQDDPQIHQWPMNIEI